MERVKSKKQMQVTHVALVPDEQADVPGVTVVERVRPAPKAKPVLDPAQRPQYSLDGYGAPVKAFTMACCAKTEHETGIDICFREKLHDESNKVRVYYAGAVLLGSASFSPSGIVTHFQHNLGAEQYTRCASVEDLHTHLHSLLRQVVS